MKENVEQFLKLICDKVEPLKAAEISGVSDMPVYDLIVELANTYKTLNETISEIKDVKETVNELDKALNDSKKEANE